MLVGVDTVTLANAAGCDSLVITTTILVEGDETNLSATTCDPMLAGVDTVTLTNASGCDSLVITTTSLLDSDVTTLPVVTTCDEALLGVDTTVLTNAAGCDSLVISETVLGGEECNNPNITDICPCTGDDPIITSIAQPGTFETEGHTQIYILAQLDGTILDSQTSGTFDVSTLEDGTYNVYALNYKDADSLLVEPSYADGLNVFNFVNGVVQGCYEILGPQEVSINGPACGCEVDCTTVLPPVASDYTVCSGSSTVIDLAGSSCSSIFFSEYIEGSSSNHALEIYNPTATSIDLGDYWIVAIKNGGAFFDTLDASGSVIAPGDVYLIVDEAADPSLLAIADTSLFFPSAVHFNGNDALLIVDKATGETVDVIGVPYVDPGSAWVVGTGSTQNHTLIRNPDVQSGVADWAIGQNQWIVQEQNYFDDWGMHTYTPSACAGEAYNFYGDEALTDLLASGVQSYDPMTAAGSSTTVWATTVLGDCESTATAITLTVAVPPSAMVQDSITICNAPDGDFPAILDLNDLITDGPNNGTGVWTDNFGVVLDTTVLSGDTLIPGASYFFTYILSPNVGNPCEGLTADVVVTVENCTGDPCIGIQAPIVADIALCGEGSTEITPFGGGFNSQSIQESFDGWDDGSYGTTANYVDDNGGMWESFNSITGGSNACFGSAVRFNDDSGANSYLLYSGIDGNGKDGGIGLIEFQYRHWNGNGDAASFLVQYSQDGGANWVNVGDTTVVDSTECMLFSELVNLQTDDVLVRIISITDEERILIDDLVITDAVALTYNFYGDDALSNLLSSGSTYDPMTTAGNTDMIWVSSIVDTCESAAVPVSVSVAIPPTATVQSSVTLCNVDGASLPESINLNDLIIEGPFNGGSTFWEDGNGDLLFFPTISGASIGVDSTASYTLVILPAAGSNACPFASYTIQVNVLDCTETDPCEGFEAPMLNNIALCEGEGGSEIIPSGGGNGETVSYNFYDDAALTTLLASGSSYDPAATAEVWVTATDGICESEAVSVSVAFTPNLTAELPDNVELCTDELEGTSTAVLNELIVTGFTNGSFVDADGNGVSTVDGATLGEGTYSYTYTTPGINGCPSNTYSFTITVIDCAPGNLCDGFEAPTADNISICEGEANTEIIPSGGGNGGEVTYNFYNDVDLTDLLASGASYDPITTATVYVTASNAVGCESTAIEVTVSVSPATATATLTTATLCDVTNEGNTALILTDLITDEDNTGVFTDADGNVVTELDGTALGAGTYTYTYTLTAIGECADNTYTTTVIVEDCVVCDGFAAPTVADITVCEGEGSSEILPSGGGLGGTVTYNFYSDAALTDLLASGTSYDPAASATVYVTASDDFCVSTAVEVSVTVNVTPIASVTGANICDNPTEGNTTLPLEALIVFGDDTGTFTDADGNVVTDVDGEVLGVGSYDYTYTVTSPDGCADNVYTFTIGVVDCNVVDPCENFEVPTVTDISVCEGEGSTEIIPSGGGNGGEVAYVFYGDIDLTTELAVGASYDPGTSVIVWVVAINASCQSEAVAVSVNVSAATGTASLETGLLCDDATEGTSTLTLSELLTADSAAGTFTDADGNEVTSVDGAVLGAGTYTYTYTVAGEGECTNNVYTTTVTVEDCFVPDPCEGFEAPSVANIDICEGEGATEIIPSGGGNGGEVTYNFYSDADLTNLLANATSYDPGAAALVWVTATDGSCESEGVQVAVIVAAPTATATLTNASICTDASEGTSTLTLTDLIADGSTAGTFTDANGNTVTELDGATLGEGTFTYTYTITGSGQCADNVYTADVTVEDCAEGVVLSIGNFVWEDENQNGIQDEGEMGVGGVIVILYTEDGEFVSQTATDIDGNYNFNDIAPGTYYLEFFLPDGYMLTSSNTGDDDEIDSDVNPDGTTDLFTVAEGDTDLSFDAGIFTDFCAGFIAVPSAICSNDGSYHVLVTFGGGDAGENGYTLTDNTTGEVVTGEAGPNYSFGPFVEGEGYSITVSITDHPECSTTVGETLVDCIVTSVELMRFDGEAQEEGNFLFWTTASERENEAFKLMRSIDGQNFELINEQPGAGNSNTIKEYNFLDKDAPMGYSYYRLDQQDFNGTIHTSRVVTLWRGDEGTTVLNISPVPAQNFVTIEYGANTKGDVEMEIYDAVGKLIASRDYETIEGINTLKLDISTYPVGVYFLSVKDGDNILTKKFIKE